MMKKFIVFFMIIYGGCGKKIDIPTYENKEDDDEETFVQVPHEANQAAEEMAENNADTQVIQPVSTIIPSISPVSTTTKVVYANLKGWKKEWNDFVVEGVNLKENISLLDNNKVPKDDMNTICPGFFSATNEQKQAVWAIFFAAMTKYESGFNPKSSYMESWGIASQGLLQLSYGDEKVSLWKPCALDKAKNNIYDPKTNLMCGTSIMRAQILKRKEIFYKDNEKSYYWAVLKTKRNNIKDIIKKAAKIELKFCNL